MRKIKRRNDITRSSNKRQKTCNQGEKRKGFSDFGEGDWCELREELASNLSQSVVSLASFDGDIVYFACTGIVIETDRSSTTILTSASLLRSFNEESFIDIIPNLTIKVRLPNNQVVYGCLQHYDLQYYIVYVTMELFPDLRAACLNHNMQVELPSELLAVRRCFNSGTLMAASGVLIDSPSGLIDIPSGVCANELMLSTCKITVAGTGGPLVDLNGNIVGMNFYGRERTPFLPRNRILECLAAAGIIVVGSNQEGCSTRERTANKTQKSCLPYSCCPKVAPELVDFQSWIQSTIQDSLPLWESDAFTDEVNEMLRRRGYPLPTYSDNGMHLRFNFEEEFCKDMWSEPTRKVAFKMSRNVVSLASFKGNARFFVCTGVFIDCNGSTPRVLTSASLVRTSDDENKIDRNLRIEVRLPNKQLAKGTLEHYNLRYNVAVVSVMDCRSLRAVKLDGAPRSKVVL